jgi:hypothetical protein
MDQPCQPAAIAHEDSISAAFSGNTARTTRAHTIRTPFSATIRHNCDVVHLRVSTTYFTARGIRSERHGEKAPPFASAEH